jgi:hypothetical protein
VLNSVASLSASQPLTAWPHDLSPELVEPCKAAGVGIKAIQAAIRKTHPALAHHFNSEERIGFKLLNIESNIVIRVLLELARDKIVPLPFHDCVMVAERHSTVAKLVMESVFESETGAKPLITKAKCDLERNTKDIAA